MPNRRTVVYIAGPHKANTIKGVKENIRKAEYYAFKYWEMGYTVLCPHKNTGLIDLECRLPDEVWLEGGIELLSRCDIIVMIPGWGHSEGSKAEWYEAINLDLEIIYEE